MPAKSEDIRAARDKLKQNSLATSHNSNWLKISQQKPGSIKRLWKMFVDIHKSVVFFSDY